MTYPKKEGSKGKYTMTQQQCKGHPYTLPTLQKKEKIQKEKENREEKRKIRKEKKKSKDRIKGKIERKIIRMSLVQENCAS